MWKLYHSAPYGSRIDYNWLWVSVPGMWFVHDQQKWVNQAEVINRLRFWPESVHVKPKSIKAFMRYLRKHPELKGHKVRFENVRLDNKRYPFKYDYDVEAVFEEETPE